MAMMESVPEPEQKPRLYITIGNERPIDAEDIGRLIRELAADYRHQTGGRLILTKLEFGSTFIELADQAVIYSAYVGVGLIAIEASERMTQFYKFLTSQLKGPEVAQAALPPPLDTSPARLLEIAANSGANLEISKGSGKSKEMIKLSFPEVSARNANAKERKRRKGRGGLSKPKKAPQLEHFTESLRAHVETDPSKMQSLVQVVIEFLKSSGLAFQLPELAQSLEAHGLWEMASIVRTHIDDGKNRVTIKRD
ncbi:hypothetical protein [Rhizobium leguminosarum]|uniref:hypothetical protein n=1 Tax=Rhizobium TaxID=379 RepID=UPI00140FDAAF|nr:hypothetical protein [Rhizobium leguminosarum]QIO65670.1 hypothetical protein HA462_11640 [Rhizobium leguminosarum bv. trifolii]